MNTISYRSCVLSSCICKKLFCGLVDLIADLAVGLLETAEIVKIVGKAVVGWLYLD